MAINFIVEDGTGVAKANAYVTTAFVDQYLEDRGRSAENAWTASLDAVKQAAIIKATDFVEKRYDSRWPGTVADTGQLLAWPRVGAVAISGVATPEDTVPLPLMQGVAEYAVRSLAVTLLPDPTSAASGSSGVVKRLKEKVGPIETDTTYEVAAGLTAVSVIPSYPAADLLIDKIARKVGPSYGALLRL